MEEEDWEISGVGEGLFSELLEKVLQGELQALPLRRLTPSKVAASQVLNMQRPLSFQDPVALQLCAPRLWSNYYTNEMIPRQPWGSNSRINKNLQFCSDF